MSLRDSIRRLVGSGKVIPLAKVRPLTQEEEEKGRKLAGPSGIYGGSTVVVQPHSLARKLGRGPTIEIAIAGNLRPEVEKWILAHERGHEAFLKDLIVGENPVQSEDITLSEDEKFILDEFIADYYALGSGASVPASYRILEDRIKDSYPGITRERFRELKNIAWKEASKLLSRKSRGV